MIDRSSFTIIGHRGGGTGIPSHGKIENTLDSFQWAFDHGADEVECDVALTKDNVLIVFHDRTIKRQWWPSPKITDLNFDEIHKRLPNVPTFDEMINQFRNKNFIIEFKTYTNHEAAYNKILTHYAADLNRFKFHSFSIEALTYIKKTRPETYCAFIATCLVERFEPFVTTDHIKTCSSLSIEEISGDFRGFRAAKIRQAQQAGLTVGLGFIDSEKSFEYCLRNGVQRMYSNKIDSLIGMIKMR